MSNKNPSPHTTLAILLGASQWPNSPGIQASEAFAHSARGLRRYLLAPHKFGLPKANLLDCFDSLRSPDDLDQEIRQFLDQRMTVMKSEGNPAKDLLLYFVGHGGFTGRDFDFYLAIRRTRMDSLTTSGMRLISLADTLKEKARHLRHLLLIDCCFAASAVKFFQSSAPEQTAILQMCEAFKMPEKGTGMPGRGTSLLCSSGHNRPSLLSPDGRYTMFSGALLHALHSGLQNHYGDLSLRNITEVTTLILQEMPEWDAPRPEIHSPDQSEGDVADIPFFPNFSLRESDLSQETSIMLPVKDHPSNARTVILSLDLIGAFLYGPHGRTVLGQVDVTIGRAADNIIPLQNQSVSQHHARIHWEGLEYSITDLGSTNGTFVNNHRLSPHIPQLLYTRSTICFSDSIFLYTINHTPAESHLSEQISHPQQQRPTPQPTERDWLTEGNHAFEKGDYQNALAAYEIAIQQNDALLDAWSNKGATLLLLDRAEEALIAYDRAISLQPNDPELWTSRASVLHNLQRYNEEMYCYDQALHYNPDYVYAWSGKAMALVEQNHLNEALVAFDRALILDPKQSTIWQAMSETLYSLYRYEEALITINRAFEIDDNRATLWDTKGNILRRLKRIEEALPFHERAIQLDPNSANAWFDKANDLRDLRRYPEALSDYDHALSLDPALASVWYNRGNVLASMHRYEDALSSYDYALKYDAALINAWYNKGSLLYELQRPLEALSAFDRALALDTHYIEAWNNKGLALFSLARLEEAIAALDQATSFAPEEPDAWYNKAIILEKLGRTKEALECAEWARSLEQQAQE